ncbi:ribosomal RNA small subunit methyltransferase A [Candidatus Saccharibacteria bacterium]|nr:ribosomal RNA small subunit methyltransferase A [Candidatus Saccharibacteria bacterium]
MVVGREQLISGMHMVGTNKMLGQHWLKNREILDEIARLAGEGELCVEIGPGLGTLTSSLLRRFEKVIAIEYDRRLAENLPKSFPGKNLKVVNKDILKFDFSSIIPSDMTKTQKYVIAGNIPYYITSPIIEKVLTVEPLPERAVLLVQKEVAERILSKKETMLSLFVKNRAEVTAGPVVSKVEFTPPPKVDSQVIILKPHTPEVSDKVFWLIQQGFKAPRKKLVHNLAGFKSKDELDEIFGELRISVDARPGDLKLADWAKLSEKV